MWAAHQPNDELAPSALTRWTAPGHEGPWILVAITLFFFLVASRLQRPQAGRRTFRVGVAVAVGAGLAWAMHLGWVADDAFITFRSSVGLLLGPLLRVLLFGLLILLLLILLLLLRVLLVRVLGHRLG